MNEIDESRWSGDMPLPDWWDDNADAAAQCEAAVLDRHGLHQVCTRPDGHAGRHLTAFAVFAGHPAVIACAWPGEHEPVASDLDDQAVLCRCDCDCADCSVTVRDDGWRYLWVGPWFLAVYARRGSIAFSAGRGVE